MPVASDATKFNASETFDHGGRDPFQAAFNHCVCSVVPGSNKHAVEALAWACGLVAKSCGPKHGRQIQLTDVGQAFSFPASAGRAHPKFRNPHSTDDARSVGP